MSSAGWLVVCTVGEQQQAHTYVCAPRGRRAVRHTSPDRLMAMSATTRRRIAGLLLLSAPAADSWLNDILYVVPAKQEQPGVAAQTISIDCTSTGTYSSKSHSDTDRQFCIGLLYRRFDRAVQGHRPPEQVV